MLTFDFETFWLLKVKLWLALYSNVICILERWIQIHAREVKISRDRQDGKMSKFDFDLNGQMTILPLD